jgi:hypothetical protein
MNYSGSIYVVTNTATSEQYVGLTRKQVQKRWAAHKRTAKCQKSKHYKLHVALQQYGEAAFVVSEVFVAFDAEALCMAEMQLIAEYAPAYNSSLGGAGFRPKHFLDAYRAQRSEQAKARWANPHWKAATVAAIKTAHNTDAARARGKNLAQYGGGRVRWADHPKPEKLSMDRAATVRDSWCDPQVRAKRIAGIKKASATAEGKLARSLASTGRVLPRAAVEQAARSKWKAVYCPELQVSFLCAKYAASYFGVGASSVSNAIKQKGKLLRKYSLEWVA